LFARAKKRKNSGKNFFRRPKRIGRANETYRTILGTISFQTREPGAYLDRLIFMAGGVSNFLFNSGTTFTSKIVDNI
jgi:hypothetical protein